MRITKEFNRLYHSAFLKDLYDQMNFIFNLEMSFDNFKQMLKYANKSYPRYKDSNDLVSTRDISSKDLVKHIEWIRRYASSYGFTLNIDEEDYRRMMELAHALGHN